MRLGLGRVCLHFQAHGLAEYSELLFHACLKNLVYDAQCEVERAPWLVQLLTADQEVELAGRLLQTLPRTRGWRDRSQQCSLCLWLARKGHSDARKALYSAFRIASDGRIAAANEIIDLDGADGLRWVSQQALKICRLRDRQEILERFIWHYEERAGKRSARSVFASCPDLKPYWPTDKQPEPVVEGKPARRQTINDFASLCVSEVLAQIDSSPSPYYIPGLKAWAEAASVENLERMAEALTAEATPHRLGHVLTVFTHRPLPKSSRNVSRLLALAEHPERMVRLRANTALAEVRHLAIRDRALSQLRVQNWLEAEILPLKSNLMPGDSVLFDRHLRVSSSNFKHHRLVTDLISICEANPWLELLKVMLFVYETSPCTSCRHQVYQLMTNRGVTPDWVACEWPYDVYQSCEGDD